MAAAAEAGDAFRCNLSIANSSRSRSHCTQREEQVAEEAENRDISASLQGSALRACDLTPDSDTHEISRASFVECFVSSLRRIVVAARPQLRPSLLNAAAASADSSSFLRQR